MAQVRIYTEIGFGNAHFISTEIEKGTRERRVRGFVRMTLKAVYIRLWLGQRVYALSTNRGFNTTHKNRKNFKLLLGFEGVPVKSRA